MLAVMRLDKMTLDKSLNAFEQWLDANYGNAHPSRIFMKNAWKAGFLYAKSAAQPEGDGDTTATYCGGCGYTHSGPCPDDSGKRRWEWGRW